MKKLRYGIVGAKTFGISWEHLQALVRLPDADVVSLCSTNASEMARVAEHVPNAVSTYADVAAMFENESLDAVIISTPNFTHEAIAVQAFDAGVHVFCEKPLAPTLAGCDAILAAAERSGRLLQVGLHRRYSRLYGRIRSLLDAGDLGAPILMWSQEFRADWGKDYKIGVPLGGVADDGGRPNWRHDQERSGGTLLEKSSHDFDVFNWFAGARATKVMGSGGLAAYEGRDTLDHAVVIVEYENGFKAELQLSLFVPHGFRGRYAGLLGDRGSVKISEGTNEMHQYFRDHPNEVRYADRESTGGHGHAIYLQQAEFAQCIREGRNPRVDGSVGRAAVAVAVAAEAAVRAGRPVRVPGPGEDVEA